jgi:hypothetical protein
MSKILEAEEKGEIIPFNLLTKRYRDSIKLVKPNRPVQQPKQTTIAHATYQGLRDRPNQGQGQNQGVRSRKPRIYPCKSGINNGMYRFEKYAYINPSVRPNSWSPDQEALKRFERALQHPTYKNAYDRAIKLYQPNSSQTEDIANVVAILAIQKPQCYTTKHKQTYRRSIQQQTSISATTGASFLRTSPINQIS